jgi:hypothetical protein
MLSMLERYMRSSAEKIALGGYPFGPALVSLSGSTIPSMYERSFFSKKSFEENDSSLTGLGFLSFFSLVCLLQRSWLEPALLALPSFGMVHHKPTLKDGNLHTHPNRIS